MGKLDNNLSHLLKSYHVIRKSECGRVSFRKNRGLYYQGSNNKCIDQLHSYCTLLLVLKLHFVKILFSHDVAYFIVLLFEFVDIFPIIYSRDLCIGKC